MRHRWLFFPVLFMTGCAPAQREAAAQVEPIINVTPPVPPPKPLAPPVGKLAGRDLLNASDQALTDSTDYVLWDKSTSANINVLTKLTSVVIRSVNVMKTNQRGNEYRAVDVAAVRKSLAALREFLSNKGD